MKILRKNDEFKKMPDKSIGDVLRIKNLINNGWNYCSKRVYKDFFKTSEVQNENSTKTKKKFK